MNLNKDYPCFLLRQSVYYCQRQLLNLGVRQGTRVSYQMGNRYFSSLAPEWVKESSVDLFYQTRPSHKDLSDKIHVKKKLAITSYKHHSTLIFSNVYSKVNRIYRSWIIREALPKLVWQYFQSEFPFVSKELLTPASDVASGLDIHSEQLQSLLKENTASNVEEIQTFLETHGKPGLTNFSTEDLKAVWKKLKQTRAYDTMVEMLNCCDPSSFTHSREILLDYSFAHLKSSYANPYLVGEIAKRLIQEKENPKARYLLGLSHSLRAAAAKRMDETLSLGFPDPCISERYRECFPSSVYGSYSYMESSQNFETAISEAITEFKQALLIEPALEYKVELILSLVEEGNENGIVEVANSWAPLLWDRLKNQSTLTFSEAKAKVIAGVLMKKDSCEFEDGFRVISAEKESGEECLEVMQKLMEKIKDMP